MVEHEHSKENASLVITAKMEFGVLVRPVGMAHRLVSTPHHVLDVVERASFVIKVLPQGLRLLVPLLMLIILLSITVHVVRTKEKKSIRATTLFLKMLQEGNVLIKNNAQVPKFV